VKIEGDNIAVLSESDEELFNRFCILSLDKDNEINANFEDSYEYIRLYFDAGDWKGMRYFDGENLIFFAKAGIPDKPSTVRYKIFKPLGAEPIAKLTALVEMLRGTTTQPIQIVCLPTSIANKLEGYKKKQYRYFIYDVTDMVGLTGQRWKNVRQKVTKFERNYGKVKTKKLSSAISDHVVHFIGAWRTEALHERGFSYTQVDKNKFAARYYADKIDEKNLWGYVYYVEGRVAAFHLMYRINDDAAANPIGLSDISIDGLAEYSQVHAWTQAAKAGIKYINDGPSWRKSLEQFKKKFNPVANQLAIECYQPSE
jgi:hypothetical protein